MDTTVVTLVCIGLAAGICAGLFGIGGGIIIVPCLVFLLGFSQHRATGTSLAVLLPPVGLIAVIEYYRNGNVDWRAGIVVALSMLLGAWGGAMAAHRLQAPILRLFFSAFLIFVGLYNGVTAYRLMSATKTYPVKDFPSEHDG